MDYKTKMALDIVSEYQGEYHVCANEYTAFFYGKGNKERAAAAFEQCKEFAEVSPLIHNAGSEIIKAHSSFKLRKAARK